MHHTHLPPPKGLRAQGPLQHPPPVQKPPEGMQVAVDVGAGVELGTMLEVAGTLEETSVADVDGNAGVVCGVTAVVNGIVEGGMEEDGIGVVLGGTWTAQTVY